MSSSSFCMSSSVPSENQKEKEHEDMIKFILQGRISDLNSMVDELSAKIEHMVPRSELEKEKKRVAMWKRRAEERKFCANRYYKDVCALEDKVESRDRRFRNLVRRTRKCIQGYHHRSLVDLKARAREKKRLECVVRTRHRVSMENQRLRAEIEKAAALKSEKGGIDPLVFLHVAKLIAALRGEGTSSAIDVSSTLVA